MIDEFYIVTRRLSVWRGADVGFVNNPTQANRTKRRLEWATPKFLAGRAAGSFLSQLAAVTQLLGNDRKKEVMHRYGLIAVAIGRLDLLRVLVNSFPFVRLSS